LLERPTSLQASMTQPAPESDPEVLLETPRKQEIVPPIEEAAQPTAEQIERPDLPLDLMAPALTAEKAPLNFDLAENATTNSGVVAESKEEPKPEVQLAHAPLNFDLGDIVTRKNEPAAPASTGVTVSEVPAVDFDRMVEFKPATDNKLSQPAPGPEMSKPVATTSGGFDFGAINLELEPTAGAANGGKSKPSSSRSGNVEMDTKIELAAAYLGIGDKEGARELLEEVIQEGAPEQVEKAKEALAKIT
jgi:pilus assembly protein FimV